MKTIEMKTTAATVVAKSKSNRAARQRLEPITLVIRDQDELRRIHRLAKHEGQKPAFSASCALRGGTWASLHAWEELTDTQNPKGR